MTKNSANVRGEETGNRVSHSNLLQYDQKPMTESPLLIRIESVVGAIRCFGNLPSFVVAMIWRR